MPASRKSDDLTSWRVHPNLPASSSYSVPLLQPGPPGEGKSLLPVLPHLVSPSRAQSVFLRPTAHLVLHCTPLATPMGGLSARPSVHEHALTHTNSHHASHHGAPVGTGSRGCHAAPSPLCFLWLSLSPAAGGGPVQGPSLTLSSCGT